MEYKSFEAELKHHIEANTAEMFTVRKDICQWAFRR